MGLQNTLNLAPTLSLSAVGVLCLTLVYLVLINWRRWFPNPAVLFAISQSTFLIGTLQLLHLDREADRVYLTVLLAGYVSFIFGTLVIRLSPVGRQGSTQLVYRRIVRDATASTLTNSLIFSLLIIGLLVVGWYYWAVGNIVFLDALWSVMMGQGTLKDIAGRRLSTYSAHAGGEYFAPGYVNQFKNVLLPLLVAFVGIRALITGSNGGRVAAAVLAPIALVGLVGTAQRQPLVYAGLSVLVFANVALGSGRARRVNFGLVVVLIAVLVAGTVVLGRSGGADHGLGAAIQQISGRILFTSQRDGIAAFRHVYRLQTQMGGEWLTELVGLLPTHSGSNLASEVFYRLFGSMRGTADVSIWTSAWHNFAMPGVIGLGFAIGLCLEGLYLFWKRRQLGLLWSMIYAHLAVIGGLWVVGSPIALVDRGLVTVVVLAGAIKSVRVLERSISSGNRKGGKLASQST